MVRTYDQLNACINAGVSRIYCELTLDTDKAYEMCKNKGIEMYIALPVYCKMGLSAYY